MSWPSSCSTCTVPRSAAPAAATPGALPRLCGRRPRACPSAERAEAADRSRSPNRWSRRCVQRSRTGLSPPTRPRPKASPSPASTSPSPERLVIAGGSLNSPEICLVGQDEARRSAGGAVAAFASARRTRSTASVAPAAAGRADRSPGLELSEPDTLTLRSRRVPLVVTVLFADRRSASLSSSTITMHPSDLDASMPAR